jgi:hypothetical protein
MLSCITHLKTSYMACLIIHLFNKVLGLKFYLRIWKAIIYVFKMDVSNPEVGRWMEVAQESFL